MTVVGNLGWGDPQVVESDNLAKCITKIAEIKYHVICGKFSHVCDTCEIHRHTVHGAPALLTCQHNIHLSNSRSDRYHPICSILVRHLLDNKMY
jgi:hypothetical protein